MGKRHSAQVERIHRTIHSQPDFGSNISDSDNSTVENSPTSGCHSDSSGTDSKPQVNTGGQPKSSLSDEDSSQASSYQYPDDRFKFRALY